MAIARRFRYGPPPSTTIPKYIHAIRSKKKDYSGLVGRNGSLQGPIEAGLVTPTRARMRGYQGGQGDDKALY
jgi:hypothetical protein